MISHELLNYLDTPEKVYYLSSKDTPCIYASANGQSFVVASTWKQPYGCFVLKDKEYKFDITDSDLIWVEENFESLRTQVSLTSLDGVLLLRGSKYFIYPSKEALLLCNDR